MKLTTGWALMFIGVVGAVGGCLFLLLSGVFLSRLEAISICVLFMGGVFLGASVPAVAQEREAEARAKK